ncbi:MAG: anhydro-N-acetylmuramic acid kinase [Nitrospirae bacterium]|nr:anhydro-N-acetylmuramic acid kinase [Nitrospirota bacterium]
MMTDRKAKKEFNAISNPERRLFSKGMKVIGLISGTSTDGIDAALVDIKGKGLNSRLKLIAYKTYPYPKGLKERIISISTKGRVNDICHLNFYLGELFANAAIGIVKGAGMKIGEVGLIGSHGQTIHHMPEPRMEGRFSIRSTLQIGEPSIIAERTGLTVVSDFRPRDIAAGGEGAPLTPYLHYILFNQPRLHSVIVNIGGISNITYIPDSDFKKIAAFDTGPGNMLIDGLMHKFTDGRKGIDRNGDIASKGDINDYLIAHLMSHPFINKKPPKTTGRESFGSPMLNEVLKIIKSKNISKRDALTTITAYTAFSIIHNIKRFILSRDEVSGIIVGGGGSRNKTILELMQMAINPIPVMTFEDAGYSSRAIEAMAFALFAYETIQNIPNNVPTATGARHPVVMGKIVIGKNP